MGQRETEGWETPKRMSCRIPSQIPCPPPPRKKSPASMAKMRDPPKGGYFQPPDLEAMFSLVPKSEACA